MDYKKRRRVCVKGCLLPFCIIFCVYAAWIIWNSQKTIYVPEMSLYAKTERFPFKEARVYFSKTTDFGNDYIEYHWYPDGPGIDLYYFAPDTFYVINEGEVVNIKSNTFKIIEIKYSRDMNKGHKNIIPDTLNSRLKPYLFEMRDSVFLKKKRLLINVWGTQWLETYDYSKELNRMDSSQ